MASRRLLTSHAIGLRRPSRIYEPGFLIMHTTTDDVDMEQAHSIEALQRRLRRLCMALMPGSVFAPALVGVGAAA